MFTIAFEFIFHQPTIIASSVVPFGAQESNDENSAEQNAIDRSLPIVYTIIKEVNCAGYKSNQHHIPEFVVIYYDKTRICGLPKS